MNRAVLTFLIVLVVLVCLTLNSMPQVPNPVAVHFNATNAPDGWTSQNAYRIAVLAALVGAPVLLVWLMGWMPRLTSGKGQVPDHHYWFDPARRRETYTFLLQHASWLGSMTAAVIYVFHILILRANALDPPQLSSERLITVILIYLFGLAWWTTAFLRHFKRFKS